MYVHFENSELYCQFRYMHRKKFYRLTLFRFARLCIDISVNICKIEVSLAP